jgi:hypothetical protein
VSAGGPGGSPWADPTTPTETGAPYSGPPANGGPYGQAPYGQVPYGQVPYGQAPYHQALYGQPSYGRPGVPYGNAAPWGVGAPRGPRRPGQVTGAAVLSFVQAGLVLCATLYVWLLVSVGRLAALAQGAPGNGGSLVVEGTVLTIVQGLSVAALLAAGALALGRRSRLAWGVVLVASVLQVALAGYWATRLPTLLSDLPSGAPDSGFAVFTVAFAAGPLVTLGLVLFRPGRSWFDGTPRR